MARVATARKGQDMGATARGVCATCGAPVVRQGTQWTHTGSGYFNHQVEATGVQVQLDERQHAFLAGIDRLLDEVAPARSPIAY